MTIWNISPTPVAAQPPESAVALTVRLRATDGAAIVGEKVTLQRLPDEADIAPPCRTDMLGACTWYVSRGLYQVLFERPLDEVSTLALAEGGLRGLGLTVGERAITYHFTFHSDGHVYFDSAPDAAIPVPLIPTADHLYGGAEEISTPEATVMPTVTTEPVPVAFEDSQANNLSDESVPQAEEEAAAIDGHWRLLILAVTGLIAGSGLHWWTRRRGRRQSEAGPRSRSTVNEATNQDQDDA